MELKSKLRTELESPDDEFSDISFEELLEQEKKDSFWSASLSPSHLLVNKSYLHIGILLRRTFQIKASKLVSFH